MRSNPIRLLVIGALLASLASVGAGTVAAAPATTADVTDETAADAESGDCVGTVCEAPCEVARKLKQDWNCAQGTSSHGDTVLVLSIDGADCTGTVCEAPCEVAEKLGKEWHCVDASAVGSGTGSSAVARVTT